MSGAEATVRRDAWNRLGDGRIVLRRLEAPDGLDTLVVAGDGGASVYGVVWGGNPLIETWSVPTDTPGRMIMAWSGTLADEPFGLDHRTWLRPGHEALAAFCDRTTPELRRGDRRLCFLPHARHVLSDPVSCLTFLREHGDKPFDIALAPVSMLEPSMTDDLEDHLRRAFETLGPAASLVILDDVERRDGELRPTTPGKGLLPPELLGDLLDRHVPVETPIVLGGKPSPDANPNPQPPTPNPSL